MQRKAVTNRLVFLGKKNLGAYLCVPSFENLLKENYIYAICNIKKGYRSRNESNYFLFPLSAIRKNWIAN